LYGGAEFSFGANFSSLLTSEDLGPSTATAAAELATLLGNHAALASAKFALTGPREASGFLPPLFSHPGDLAARLLSQQASSSYSAAQTS
jgi:hypothetical protein